MKLLIKGIFKLKGELPKFKNMPLTTDEYYKKIPLTEKEKIDLIDHIARSLDTFKPRLFSEVIKTK